MRPRDLCALGLLCAGLALAGPQVEVALRDGRELAGELVAFEARTFRLQLADGSLRAIGEDDVRAVRFVRPAEPTTLEGRLAAALRQARGSGALERDVLGVRHFKLTERARVRERFTESDRTRSRVREWALRVEVRDTEQGLRLEVERRPLGLALATPEEGPSRMRCWVDAQGRVSRWTLRTPIDCAELRATAEGYALEGEGRWYGASSWAVREGALPREVLQFVCAPLHELGFPARFELAAWDERGPQPSQVVCERLPGPEFRGDEQVSEVRVLEGAWETSLWLGAEAGGDRRLRAWSRRRVGLGLAVSFSGEPIDAAAYAELVAAPGVAPAPADALPVLPALAPELQALLSDPPLGTRTYRWVDDLDGAPWVVQVQLRRGGSGLLCEVRRHSPGLSDQATTRCVWTARGLGALRLRYPTNLGTVEALFAPGAEGWRCTRGRGSHYGDEVEEVEAVACAPPPAQAVPRELTRFLLPGPALTYAEDAWLLGLTPTASWGPRQRPQEVPADALSNGDDERPRGLRVHDLMRERLEALRDAHARAPGADLATLAGDDPHGLDAPLLLALELEPWAAIARPRLPGRTPTAYRVGATGKPTYARDWLAAEAPE